MVCANLIKCVLPPSSANAKRMLKTAKEDGSFLDMTSGHTTKCLLLLQDGTVIGCALTAKTIVARVSQSQEEENENH